MGPQSTAGIRLPAARSIIQLPPGTESFPLKKHLQTVGQPNALVRFVLPTKYIAFVDLPVCMNGKCKLVSAAIRAEKEKVVEWHIKLLETFISAKHLILLLNL